MWIWRSRADDAAVERDAAGRAFERAAGRVPEVAGLADGRVDAELELLGHRDLHLRGLARRTQHAHAFDPALRPDDGELFLAGELAGLGEVALAGELVALTEERLDMFLAQMDVVGGDLEEERLGLLGLEHARQVGAAQRPQRLARDHPLLVRRDDEHGDAGIVGRDAADLVKAACLAVARFVQPDAHAFQTLDRQATARPRCPVRCRR